LHTCTEDFMNPRLAKEFRPLLFPWCVAALGAVGYLVALADPIFAKGEFGSFLIGLAGCAFVAGCLLLAAMPMGSELQERTLALLLSQPMDRSRLWKEKLLAATIAVGALALVHGVATIATGQLRLGEALLCLIFMVAAICSVGYWTLATRSVIGGIVAAVSTPIWVSFAIHLTVYYGLGLRPEFDEWTTVVLAICAGAVYSAFFLWLGRRQFAELELKDTLASRSAQIPEALVPKKLVALFRCRPSGALRNLIRKEVCLQKPIFLISAVFTICWLLTLLLLVLEQSDQVNQHIFYVSTLNALTAIQITLTVVLAGCVSLGEEKSLGLAAWHLTLPVSARRQWLVKLGTAGGVFVLMGLVLPSLLALLTSIKTNVGLVYLFADKEHAGSLWTLAVLGGIFVLSFWSASLVANTVRAVLTLVLTCIALGTAASFAFWSAEKFGGLQTGFLTSLIARFQWSPYSLDGVFPWGGILLCLIAGATLIALVQSFSQFRRAQSQSATLFRHGAILAAVAFAIAFWVADFNVSMNNQRNQRFPSALVPEVTAALRSVTLHDFELPSGQIRRLKPQELNNGNSLSDTAKLWLKGATIEVRRFDSKSKHFAHERVYGADIYLHNGVIVPFGWTVPDVETDPGGKK
jgi:hypothetical protein